MERTGFVTHDGKEISLCTWADVKSPKAVVLIAHGMAEHCQRYDHFASYLNQNGFVVVSVDQRGHGFSAAADSLGFDEGDMFANDVEDKIFAIKSLKTKYKLPVILFGHSYGSFVTQSVMQSHSQADGFVLCGSNYIKGLSYTACGVIARWLCKHRGGRHPAETIAKLSFGGYEKKIKGKNNWLSRDPEHVQKYNDDEKCGFVCSAHFYRCFMNGIDKLYKKVHYNEIDRQKPLLIVAGQCDPVGEYGKGVKKLQKFYQKKVGVEDLTTHLYAEARHEILNEINRDEVYQDVLKWLNEKVKAQ